MIHLTESHAENLFEQSIVCAAPVGIPYFNVDQAIEFGQSLMKGAGCRNKACLREFGVNKIINDGE